MDFHLPRSPTPTMVARSIFRDQYLVLIHLPRPVPRNCMRLYGLYSYTAYTAYTSPYIIQLYTAFIQLIHYTSLSTPPQTGTVLPRARNEAVLSEAAGAARNCCKTLVNTMRRAHRRRAGEGRAARSPSSARFESQPVSGRACPS